MLSFNSLLLFLLLLIIIISSSSSSSTRSSASYLPVRTLLIGRADRSGPSPVAWSRDPSSLHLSLILPLSLCNRIKNLRSNRPARLCEFYRKGISKKRRINFWTWQIISRSYSRGRPPSNLSSNVPTVNYVQKDFRVQMSLQNLNK